VAEAEDFDSRAASMSIHCEQAIFLASTDADFITSATGYVGAAVARCLRAHGHSISALARTPDSEQRLRSTGIQIVPGDLARPESYREAAAQADVIVHTAFEYSPDGAENLELDLQATRALLRGQRLIYTSNGYRPRYPAERAVLAAGTSNSVLRLGMVYGGTGGGTIISLFGSAHRTATCPIARGRRQPLVVDSPRRPG
jgi:nucleoside-diphosphate-sugar epimerase